MNYGDPAQLFHCTPVQYLGQILEEGLRPEFGWKSEGMHISNPHCTQLFKPYKRIWGIFPISLSIGMPMVGFIGDITQAYQVAVLEVDAWGLNLGPDPDGPGFVAVYEWIPPHLIRHVRTERRPEGGW